ncbi:carbonic anhydrase [Bacillus benzoevorans]|uniref:Carbonic anhydrase n=2 Tax=Bacillus benzoevorans TaxID=1456 RepID=A0A7X0HNU3_9BACI|nr:carbonic anhydrase [Bacillus benzoevorans]
MVSITLSAFTEAPKESKKVNPIHAQTVITQNTEEPHWSYEGETGPPYWGQLDPSFASCEKGREQSPIPIESSLKEGQKELDAIKGQYQPAAVMLLNTGHAIQADVTAPNNKIRIDGKVYNLLQFHFHNPSEHKINGKQYPMEIHFVHQDEHQRIVVLGVMIEEGKENGEISALLKNLDHDRKMTIDIKKLIPSQSRVFQYNGSLTTPPCTEGVKWVVLNTPLELSQEQIHAFGEFYQNNNRPLQPLHKREIMVGSFRQNK